MTFCDWFFWISCWLFVFFFFKQKTAYEMRISDWSSDVCSSDLRFHVSLADLGERHVEAADQECGHPGRHRIEGDRLQRDAAIKCAVEIGRASCRERVCQYV